MKTIKKLSVVIIALAMCVLLGVAVLAEAGKVEYSAELNKPLLCVSDKEQKVTLTLKMHQEYSIDSFGATVVLPTGWKIESIVNDTLTFTDDDYNLSNGSIVWTSDDAENVNTTLLATITIIVPANAAAGTYTISVKDIEITQNYGTVIDAVSDSVSVEVKIREHSYNISNYTNNGDTHTAHYVCGNDATHTKSDAPVAHTYDKENGTKCVCGAEKPVTVVKGDVDCNGNVGTLEDFTMLARHYMGYEYIVNEQSLANSDINGDGSVDLNDLNSLARYYMGYDDTLE